MSIIDLLESRLSELELAKNYLNSDYYWTRKHELENAILKVEEEKKFNQEQST